MGVLFNNIYDIIGDNGFVVFVMLDFGEIEEFFDYGY